MTFMFLIFSSKYTCDKTVNHNFKSRITSGILKLFIDQLKKMQFLEIKIKHWISFIDLIFDITLIRCMENWYFSIQEFHFYFHYGKKKRKRTKLKSQWRTKLNSKHN
ncbi:uncharacterized protein LOC143146066 [Ptiloglossa arizonensis]|uniref:uncharacterized protein LOC143146066 n=1 Tax=Ptiloglossa arizonensis TaxID=3350558 RepID=UPI003FA0D760